MHLEKCQQKIVRRISRETSLRFVTHFPASHYTTYFEHFPRPIHAKHIHRWYDIRYQKTGIHIKIGARFRPEKLTTTKFKKKVQANAMVKLILFSLYSETKTVIQVSIMSKI